MEEETHPSRIKGWEWRKYVLCSEWANVAIRCHSEGMYANLNGTVITDPEDSRFDLEAYLKSKAGEPAK
jgi:hypothetical protein